MTTRSQVTNERVARDLGVTHSAISRIRSGTRLPSLRLVRVIERRFHWPASKQVSMLTLDEYGMAFEQALERHYG